MKQITIETQGGVEEIKDSQCYRRNNDPCSDACPFFYHDSGNPIGDILLLTCNTYQTILLVIAYE